MKKSIFVKYYPQFLLLILAFTFISRTYRLNVPERYVFDEVYHAVTAKLMVDGDTRAYEWTNPPPEPNTAVDWLHPPYAKLTQTASMFIFGKNSFGWRFSSVIFGCLVVWVTAKITEELFSNKKIALLSAFLISLDGLLFTMSRIAMNDVHVTFFILLSMYYYIKYINSKRKLKKLLIFSSIAAGFAIGTKWSGIFSIGFIGISETIYTLKIFFRTIKTNNKSWFQKNIKFWNNTMLETIKYNKIWKNKKLWGIKNKFWLGKIIKFGKNKIFGKAKYNKILKNKKVKKIKHSKVWKNKILTWKNLNFKFLFKQIGLLLICCFIVPAILYLGSYSQMFLLGKDFNHLVEMHKNTWWYQTNLTATHPAQSKPIEWFLNTKPVWISVIYEKPASRADIYAIGNPALFWLGNIGIFATLITIIWAKYKKKQSFKKLKINMLALLLFAYSIVWLPWTLSPRIMFFYHYLPAVPLLSINLAYWIHQLWNTQRFRIISALIVLLVVVCFVILYPHLSLVPMPIEFKDRVYFFFDFWKQS